MRKYKANNTYKKICENIKQNCNTCVFSMYNDKSENICAGKYYNKYIREIDKKTCEEWEPTYGEFENACMKL